jgi:drug/metabolite transporter (DMT)-like permease
VAPGRLRVTTRELPALVGLGFAGAAMVQWLYFVAIDRLPVGVALLLEFTAPALVALYAWVGRREYVRSRTWLAIGLAFGGVALVAQVWRDAGLDPLGVAAGLGAALCLATYLLVGGRTATTRDAASLTFYMFAFGAAFWAIAQPWWVFETAPFGDLIAAGSSRHLRGTGVARCRVGGRPRHPRVACAVTRRPATHSTDHCRHRRHV